MEEESRVEEVEAKTINLEEKVVTPPIDVDVFCLRFSDDGNHVACGCGDGSIRIFSSITGKQVYSIASTVDVGGFPTTCLRFRPVSKQTKTRNVLLAVNSSGVVQHWHVTSGKCIHSITEEKNQVFCVDYNKSGSMFATAGKDYTVRVYDEATKTLVHKMRGGHGTSTAGHSNRVFSLRFHPSDPNIILTGGWDNTVQIWDIRDDHARRSIFGPHVCGDAVDAFGDLVLTGSWRPENQVQVWDFATGELVRDYPIRNTGMRMESNMTYSAEFSRNGLLISCCGSGANEAKVIDRQNGQELLSVQGGEDAFYTTDFSPDSSKVAFSGAGGRLHIYEINVEE